MTALCMSTSWDLSSHIHRSLRPESDERMFVQASGDRSFLLVAKHCPCHVVNTSSYVSGPPKQSCIQVLAIQQKAFSKEVFVVVVVDIFVIFVFVSVCIYVCLLESVSDT